MVVLSLQVADVFDDVVRDDEVESLVLEGQRRAGDEAEADALAIEALVDDVDCPYLTRRANAPLERLRDDS